ncbi:MAG: hypothetical protein NC416_17765 [Eubacterium sp.]|nr:hypothetical protein [Eubacterium sp.]
MRLYKTELYKLCHKKFFVVGTVCTFAILSFLFFQNLHAQRSTINGVEYHGYEAVRANQQITEEFKGILTNEKLQQIADKYGFPQRMVDHYGFADSNFLNQFVMTYASDGYYYDWDNYQIATKVLPIDDTLLGDIRTTAGQDIYLACYVGWDSFPEWYFLGMILISILILCLVATVFSGEEQSGTKPLLFTTKEGPAKDTHAKVAAAFTLSVLLWLCVTVFSFVLYSITFGLDSLGCLAMLVLGFSEPIHSFGVHLAKTFLLSLSATLELCAVTLYLSARCRSAFHSICAATVCWVMPILALMALRSIYQVLMSSPIDYSVLYVLSRILFMIHLSLYASPFYLIHQDILSELDAISIKFDLFCVILALAILVAVLCVIGGYRRYCKIHRT